MLEHNPNLKEHKILLDDCRSLLKFNNKQVKDIEEELYLFNDFIKIIFQFLKDIKLFEFEFDFGLKLKSNLKGHSSCLSSYEIMSNKINWSLIIEINFNSIIDFILPFDILEWDLIKKIKENPLNIKLSYFEVKIKETNSIKIIDNKFIDIYGIIKDVKTFTQRDDNIRQQLYKILFNETEIEGKNKQNMLFIGGEFYGFLKNLFNNYNIAYGITDFKGIKEDAEYNNPTIKVDLVNYDTFTFDKEQKDIDIEIQFDICIVNLLNGLGYNLIKELKKIKTLRKIIIISCKQKAIERDIKFIKEELKEFNFLLTDIYNLETTRQTLKIYIFQNT